MSTAPTQEKYEVRVDWGADGVARVAPDAGVIILVDALASRAPAALLAAAEPFGVPVLQATLRDRRAVAAWVLGRQEALGRRLRVAIVAASAEDSPAPVENLLAVGAVVDALAELGIDYSSPEAAAACAAFTGLRRAVGHLYTASVAGVRLIEAGRRSDVERAAEVDASEDVVVLAHGDATYAARA